MNIIRICLVGENKPLLKIKTFMQSVLVIPFRGEHQTVNNFDLTRLPHYRHQTMLAEKYSPKMLFLAILNLKMAIFGYLKPKCGYFWLFLLKEKIGYFWLFLSEILATFDFSYLAALMSE